MPFTHGLLIDAIMDGVGSTKEYVRANADNLRWDERLSPSRVACFEQPAFLPKEGRWHEFVDGYADYFVERLEWTGSGPVTEPFGPDNEGASLNLPPDEGTELIRVAKVAPVLRALGLTLAKFRGAVDLHVSSRPEADDPPVLDARAMLQEFVDKWNAYDQRAPAFVGFARDVPDELAAPDVLVRLRDRFGMGRMHVAPGAASIPAMLLRYPVKEVSRAAKRFCSPDAALRVPTVLDANLYEYFFPAPTPLPHGRTANLTGELDDKKLTCELIHLPVDLELGHIAAVGEIDRPIPDLTLARVRDVHLWLLRYDTDREDFGEYMSGHEPS